MNTRLLLILFLPLIFSCGGNKEIPLRVKEPESKVHYDRSEELVQVLERAEKQNKIVFLDVYTDWCLPCKIFSEEVLNHDPTADKLNDNFINYKVNAEKLEGPDITLIYSVDAYPTLLFLDYRGRVLDRHVGGIGIQKFNTMVERVLQKGVSPY